jgi:hypothetical protein
MKKLFEILALVLLGLPLIIYPFVLLANAMSMFGHRSPNTPISEMIFPFLFMISTTLYPGSYILGWIFYIRKKNAKFIQLPFLHLVFCLLLFVLWNFTEG